MWEIRKVSWFFTSPTIACLCIRFSCEYSDFCHINESTNPILHALVQQTPRNWIRSPHQPSNTVEYYLDYFYTPLMRSVLVYNKTVVESWLLSLVRDLGWWGSKQDCVRCYNTVVANGGQLLVSDRACMLRVECIQHLLGSECHNRHYSARCRFFSRRSMDERYLCDSYECIIGRNEFMYICRAFLAWRFPSDFQKSIPSMAWAYRLKPKPEILSGTQLNTSARSWQTCWFRCCLCRPKVLRASAAGIASTDAIGSTNSKSGDGGEEDIGYKTFLVHLYDLLEEKISTERYDEGVRQLVGNQVK